MTYEQYPDTCMCITAVALGGWAKKYKHWFGLARSTVLNLFISPFVDPVKPILSHYFLFAETWWSETQELFCRFVCGIPVIWKISCASVWTSHLPRSLCIYEICSSIPRMKIGESSNRLSIPECLTIGIEPSKTASHVRWQSSPFPERCHDHHDIVLGLINSESANTWWRERKFWPSHLFEVACLANMLKK